MEATYKNQNPEQIARDKIDDALRKSGWLVQSKNEVNLSAGLGVAVREYQTDIGPADYVLFIDRKPVGVIEAKREELGISLLSVAEQSTAYAKAKLKYLNNDPLPFIYESTGTITRFTDTRDPKPRSRSVFSFHRPETLQEWKKQNTTLRERLLHIPELKVDGLRPAQIVAIENLEKSFKKNKPKALIQMATGSGKTFTAASFIYRLLKYANAKRILFLVDTKNLGEQAEQEFIAFQPNDDNRKFIELYNVQRLNSHYIASDSHVCISTIQRLYSILKGEELEESAELENPNENTWLQQRMKEKEAIPVAYNEKVPIEEFDFIVIDECHRSIYNLWKQVLDYFDAFLIGLTATPDKRTLGFFNENIVSEYSYEESVIDGVNVPYEVYLIETEISTQGSKIKSGWYLDHRDKLSRKKRWQREDEDLDYGKNDLDKKIVNPSQIRHIIKEFKNSLQTHIFPKRKDVDGNYEVPKTLVFAKTDSHADDIIKIIREEFNEGNEFCKKITYKIDEDPKSVLSQFRNSYYPRIAVTVDMIATGTDVKPIEVLLFMRDVKSLNYFEQMKGRGCRSIQNDSLQLVTRTADCKTHFVIVDAVGATKSKKTDSRPLERKPSIPLKDLLNAVTMGASDEDLFLSLANRLIRLDKQLKQEEKEKVLDYSNGKTIKQMAKELISAYDPDAIEAETQEKLILEAAKTFNGELNNYLDNVRKIHEQIIDHINTDTVTKSEWDASSIENAEGIIRDFTQYIEENKDEITALSIFYNQPYNRRNITFNMIKEILEKLKLEKPNLNPTFVWDAYSTVEEVKSTRPKDELTALVSLIRRVTGIDKRLKAFDSTINKNFQQWIFKQNAGQHNRFTSEQIEWLKMIKDHIVSSYHLELDDLDCTPFDAQGGRGKMYQLFGDEMQKIIDELNEVLVA